MFIKYLFTDPRMFFSAGLIVVLSICCHEYMHALAALKNGDPTAADNGHLTLNPLKQMGWFSLIMFCFLGLAWGQVPVDHRRMKSKYSPLIVSLAGPATNLVLSMFFLILSYLTIRFSGNKFAFAMLFYGAQINLVLFVLNMLPVPGLDGWTLAEYFLIRRGRPLPEFVNGAIWIFMALIFFFIEKIYQAASYVCQEAFMLLLRLGGPF